jgi:hypothetical protein
MSALTPIERDRVLALLADRALGDLSPADAGELSALLDRAGEEPGFEGLIAGLVVAADDAGGPAMPAALRASLQNRGERLVGGGPVAKIGPRPGTPASTGWMGWGVAAAACVFAAVGWLRPQSAPGGPNIEQRLATLEDETDTVVLPFDGMGELAGQDRVGEIVWNERLQEGFLRLSAVPSNNPAEAQYQLWIFDASRDATYPVDAGVFNVAAGSTGEVVVPFEPKLGVGDAAAFAVTKERPGGVVVTDKAGLMLLAPVETTGG